MRVSGGRWVAIGAMTCVTLAGGAYVLYAADDDADAGAGTSQPTPSPTDPPFPAASPAGSVLAGLAADAPAPTAAGVSAALAPLLADPDLGGRVTASVVDALTGEVLLDRTAQLSITPASTAKLLTAVAALESLGEERRLATTVVAGAQAGQIVLVGAGDSTLRTDPASAGQYPARASVADLATRTAAALRTAGTTSVSIGFDASLFAGPGVNPSWQPTYVSSGQVAPVSALMVDGGRVSPGGNERSPDPALEAAKRFAAALAAGGIVVTGAPVPAQRAADAAVLASVESPTVGQLVETMLVESDNDVAEALARLVGAETATPAAADASAAAVLDAVAQAGVTVQGVTLRDGSGLSRSNSVPAQVLTSLLVSAASSDALAEVVAGLPVAGYTGTLDERFDNDADRAGAGLVRAKTGTLNGVTALSGTLEDVDGRLLAFAFMADQVAIDKTLDARATFDAAAATLALCGCR